MKTDRLQVRMDYIEDRDKPYRNETEGKINYTEDYVKWLEDKVVDNINYSQCCKSDSEQLKGKHPLTFSKWREINGYTPYDNSSYQKDNKIINVDKLEIRYRAYYKTF